MPLLSDLRGYSQLAIDATLGVTDLVEAMQANLLHAPRHSLTTPQRLSGLSGLIYNNIRGVMRLMGFSLDKLLALLGATLETNLLKAAPSDERETARAVINGGPGLASDATFTLVTV